MESLPAPCTPRLVLVPEVLPSAVEPEVDDDPSPSGDYRRPRQAVGLLVDVYG